MPDSIENYVSQATVEKIRRQAWKVWGFFAFLTAFWVFLIVLAPLAEINGLTGVSDTIYKICSYVCHQISDRSPHIHDHVLAVCSRCFGVYFGLFFGFAAYPFARPIEKTDAPPRFWLFAAMFPIGIDFSLGFFGIWENTHLSRFMTGAILGAACAVFIIPALIEIFRFLPSKKQVKRLSR